MNRVQARAISKGGGAGEGKWEGPPVQRTLLIPFAFDELGQQAGHRALISVFSLRERTLVRVRGYVRIVHQTS
ncbi:MAG TPA: hypothetical protein VL122_07805 [Nitrospirota bacterium]|nr:hypothetical protein [Nitrospirota bacterium]